MWRHGLLHAWFEASLDLLHARTWKHGCFEMFAMHELLQTIFFDTPCMHELGFVAFMAGCVFFVCRPAASGDTKAPQPAAAGNAKQRPMPRPIATKGGTAKEKAAANLKSKKPPVVRAMQMHDTGARSKIKTPVKPAATKAASVASKPAKPSSKQPAAIPTPAAAPAKKATLMASFPKFKDIPIPPAVPAQRAPPTPPPKLTVAPKSWTPAPPPPAVVLQFAALPRPPPPKLVLGAS